MSECEFWEYGLDEFMQHLKDEAYKNRIPLKGGFELTPRCNFNCNMCYVHLKPDEIPAVGRELTTQEWIGLAREAQQAGTLELTLTGGEPFVRPDFREIYETLHDMGFLIQIFSNGYLINEDTVAWLKARPPKSVRFTLYGASDAGYEKVCGISGGFTRVKQSVKLLKEAGIPLYLVATVTKENVHEIDSMYRFAAENNLPMIHTTSLINPVRGASANAKEHQIEPALPPVEEIRRIREQSGGKFPRKPCTDFMKVCKSYRCGYWITWDGSMQLCTFLSDPAVPFVPGKFVERWHTLLEKLEQLRQPEKCSSCIYEQYCERCPGLLYAEAGENGKISDEFCRKAERTYFVYGKPLDEIAPK